MNREPIITIRAYQAEDLSQVEGLWHEVFPDSSGHNAPVFAIDRKTSFNDGLFFVAMDGEELVGTAMGGYDGHRGWIYLLAVKPTYQRLGIGTQLVQHVEKELRKLGSPKVNLQIRAENSAVASFYRSLGYATEERISMGKKLG